MEDRPYTTQQVQPVANISTASSPGDSSMTGGVNVPQSPVMTAAFPGVGGVGYILVQVPNQYLTFTQPLPATGGVPVQPTPGVPALMGADILLTASMQPASTPGQYSTNVTYSLPPSEGRFQNPRSRPENTVASIDDSSFQPVASSTFVDTFPQPDAQPSHAQPTGVTQSAPFLSSPAVTQQTVTMPAPPSAGSLPVERPKSAQPLYRREYVAVGFSASQAPPGYEASNYTYVRTLGRSPPADRTIRYRVTDNIADQPTLTEQRSPVRKGKEAMLAQGKPIDVQGSYYVYDGQIIFDPPLQLSRTNGPSPEKQTESPKESPPEEQVPVPEPEPEPVPEPELQPVKTEFPSDDWLASSKGQWVQTPREWIRGPVSEQSNQTPCAWEGGAFVAETDVQPEYCASSCPTSRDLGIRKKKRKKLCCDNCKEARKERKNRPSNSADKTGTHSRRLSEEREETMETEATSDARKDPQDLIETTESQTSALDTQLTDYSDARTSLTSNQEDVTFNQEDMSRDEGRRTSGASSASREGKDKKTRLRALTPP